MRNPYEYPVETSEIVKTLNRLIEQERRRGDEIGLVGDHTCWFLQEAIKRIESAESWHVSRLDDNGNLFTVRAGLSWDDAHRLCGLLTARGHKQTYSVGKDNSGVKPAALADAL